MRNKIKCLCGSKLTPPSSEHPREISTNVKIVHMNHEPKARSSEINVPAGEDYARPHPGLLPRGEGEYSADSQPTTIPVVVKFRFIGMGKNGPSGDSEEPTLVLARSQRPVGAPGLQERREGTDRGLERGRISDDLERHLSPALSPIFQMAERRKRQVSHDSLEFKVAGIRIVGNQNSGVATRRGGTADTGFRGLKPHGYLREVAPRLPAMGMPMVVVAVVMLGLLTGCSPKGDEPAQTSFLTASNVTLTAEQRSKIGLHKVAQATYHKTIETTGAVDFDNDQATSVLAPFGGPVTRILVSAGDKVKAGEALAVVDSPDYALAISTYRKALATAVTDRRVADYDKDLAQHNGVSQREADQAETDAVNAEADRDAALQALVSLNVDPQVIKDLQAGRAVGHPGAPIRSPIAGTVVEKLVTPGELLTAGTTPCFTVADLSRVWVMTQIFGTDLASVRVGDQAQLRSGIATNVFTGTVDNISALVNPDTRAVLVRVVVENPGDFLKKQMYVSVRIEARQESTGLLVPVSAVLRDDENLAFVYVVQPDGSFARQHVTLGYRTADQYDIPEGLKAGDQVVDDGALFVQFLQNQ